MKTCIAINILLICLYTEMFSQKNDFQRKGFLGGDFILSCSNNAARPFEKRNNKSFVFTPKYGYFISDSYLIGSEITLGFYSTTFSVSEKVIILSPLIRYYLSFNLFLEFNTGIGYGKYQVSQNGYADINKNKNKYFVTQLGGGIGYSIFFKKRLSLEPLLIIKKQTFDIRNLDQPQYLTDKLGVQLSFNLGFNYYY